jgi:hypothetical protein
LPVDWMLKHRFDSIGSPADEQPLLCFIAERDDVIPPSMRDDCSPPGRAEAKDAAGARPQHTDARPVSGRGARISGNG